MVQVFGQSSVLQSGSWYKVAVEKRGVYKITYDDFKKMGFDTRIDPRRIQVFGNVGGMLPQSYQCKSSQLISRRMQFLFLEKVMGRSIKEIIFYFLPKDPIEFNIRFNAKSLPTKAIYTVKRISTL